MPVHTEWLTHPLLTDALLVCGLGVCLGLLHRMKRDIRQTKTRAREATEGLSKALENATGELQDLRTAFTEHAAPAAAPVILQRINVTKRSQALAMYRRGEPAASAAGALGIPRNELELLFKVQRLLEKPAERTPNHTVDPVEGERRQKTGSGSGPAFGRRKEPGRQIRVPVRRRPAAVRCCRERESI